MNINKCRITFAIYDPEDPVLLKLAELGSLYESINDECYRYDLDSVEKLNEFSNWLSTSDECDSWTLVYDCVEDNILYLGIDMF